MLRSGLALLLSLSLVACGSSDDGGGGGPSGPTSGWRSEAVAPAAVQEVAATTADGKIYVAGGFEGSTIVAKVRVYDPATDSWRDAPDLPAPRHHLALVAMGSDVYAIGGMTDADFTPTDKAWVLKAGASQWDPLSSLTLSRGAAVAAAVGGKIYLFGGIGDYDKLLGDVVTFDPTTGNWTVASALPTPRDHLAVFVDAGKIYTVGGRFLGAEQNTTKVEIFDPANGTWTDGPELPTARGGLGAAVLGGRAYVIGGETTTEALTTVEVLDLTSQTWSEGEPLPTPRHGAAVAEAAGRVWVIGGANVPGFGALDVVESYAPLP